MKNKRSIQFKAAFLMIVFSLNTIIGFACAVGINMGFNTSHHHEEEETEAVIHIHKDGKKHVHQEAAKHHDEVDKDNDHDKKDSNDNCCNDKVIKFNEVDKSSSHSFNAGVNRIFFTTFLASFYNLNIFYKSYINTGSKYFVRSYHPPIPDIRIAIQSFQI